MRRWRVALLAGVLWAQERPEFRAKVELATIPCSVVDARGAAVTDLDREEFRVFDNGVARKVEYLGIDTDEPVTLGILIDNSESQGERAAEHRRTAVELLERVMRPGDRAFVVWVDAEVRLWAGPAGSAAEIRRQMDAGRGATIGSPCPLRGSMSACGSSPLWNAVHETARVELRGVKGTKALVMLTDGFDSGSTYAVAQAIDEAVRAEAAVYAVQYPGALGGTYASALYRLVGETGGTWFPPPEGDYGRIVERLETDLRHRYVVGFRPETLSFGKPRHEVRVEVTRPGAVVRARKTYFEDR